MLLLTTTIISILRNGVLIKNIRKLKRMIIDSSIPKIYRNWATRLEIRTEIKA